MKPSKYTIKTLRKQGKTLKEIGAQYKRSGERIRQVLNPRFRPNPDTFYKHYAKSIKALDLATLEFEESLRLKHNRSRTREVVLQKAALIKELHKRGLTYARIGELLGYSYSTILHVVKTKF